MIRINYSFGINGGTNWDESVVWLFNPLKSLSLFLLLDSTRHPFVYFLTVKMII